MIRRLKAYGWFGFGAAALIAGLTAWVWIMSLKFEAAREGAKRFQAAHISEKEGGKVATFI